MTARSRRDRPRHIRYVSPLRYPGGKAKLAGFIKHVLRRNRLLDAHYVEPYAGGASVALELLLGEYASHIHLNDIDGSVFAFWHSVLNETDSLCSLIRKAPITTAQWRRQRAIQANAGAASLLELGFSTLFLNRTNRSGIITSGGMIGGRAQLGEWKLGARFNKPELIRRIERIAAYRDRISLYRQDAALLMRRLQPRLPERSFLYLDPPYYVKGSRRLYANYYEHADHQCVASMVRTYPRPWIVSYDDAPQIRALYRGLPRIRYRLAYTARDRYEGSEILFHSPELRVPRTRDPLVVSDGAQ